MNDHEIRLANGTVIQTTEYDDYGPLHTDLPLEVYQERLLKQIAKRYMRSPLFEGTVSAKALSAENIRHFAAGLRTGKHVYVHPGLVDQRIDRIPGARIEICPITQVDQIRDRTGLFWLYAYHFLCDGQPHTITDPSPQAIAQVGDKVYVEQDEDAELVRVTIGERNLPLAREQSCASL